MLKRKKQTTSKKCRHFIASSDTSAWVLVVISKCVSAVIQFFNDVQDFRQSHGITSCWKICTYQKSLFDLPPHTFQ